MRLTKVHYTVLDAVYRQGRAILYRVLTKKTMGKSSREEQSVTRGRETFTNFLSKLIEMNSREMDIWKRIEFFFRIVECRNRYIFVPKKYSRTVKGRRFWERKKACVKKMNHHRNAAIFIAIYTKEWNVIINTLYALWRLIGRRDHRGKMALSRAYLPTVRFVLDFFSTRRQCALLTR